jgi:hypothetical protein
MDKLNLLDAWRDGVSDFFAPKSAQGYLRPAVAAVGTSRGSSCGAGDDAKDEPKPKPTACGSSCGAGDDAKDEPKPSVCGSSCGAGEQK